MTTATKNRKRRKTAAPAPAETPAPAMTAAARSDDERLQDAAAFLRCHLKLWQQRNQEVALDDYLGRVDTGDKTANLRQYSEYHRTVQSAADILRGSLSDQLQSAGYREPAFTSPQPWECPDCHCLLGQPGEKHEPCDIPVAILAISGHEPVDGPVVTDPRVFSSELPEEDEARFEAVFGPNVRVLPASEDDPPGLDGEPAEVPHVAGDGDENGEQALDKGPLPEAGKVTTPSGTYELETPQPEGES